MRIRLGDRAIAYDLLGPADGPVLCMTHSLAADGGMWAEQVPALLGAGYRVLRLDMRGHGGSDPLAGPYAMADLAADVAAVLERLALAPVHYVGLSIGGMLGQALALARPDLLASALWADTLPATPAGMASLWQGRIATVRAANTLAPIADATMERWFTPAFAPRHPARFAEIREGIAATTPAGYMGCCAAIADFDFTARLPGLRLPVLVVCGADDPGTPPEANRHIAALVPGARYQEIPAARHFPNVEQPDDFNRILLGWLAARRG
ncbi:MAG: 3-oxoadipate enol-lactonase [Rhodospirillales bacterium]|nr:3-oxoadipate enol-lactonase [Rhodospirillales bacterium]